MRVRFSIRELLLIVVIAALAVGWWVDHLAHRESLRKAKQLLIATHGPHTDAEWEAGYQRLHKKGIIK